jgi:hypothetical protein
MSPKIASCYWLEWVFMTQKKKGSSDKVHWFFPSYRDRAVSQVKPKCLGKWRGEKLQGFVDGFLEYLAQ